MVITGYVFIYLLIIKGMLNCTQEKNACISDHVLLGGVSRAVERFPRHVNRKERGIEGRDSGEREEEQDE